MDVVISAGIKRRPITPLQPHLIGRWFASVARGQVNQCLKIICSYGVCGRLFECFPEGCSCEDSLDCRPFTDAAPQKDDMTLLVMGVRPESCPTPGQWQI